MRVAFVGNLCGLGLAYARGLRANGIDAHLFLSKIADVVADPELAGLTDSERSFVHFWNAEADPRWRDSTSPFVVARRKISTALGRLGLLRSLRSFDIVHTFAVESIYSRPAARRLVAQATGADLNEVVVNHVRGLRRSLLGALLLRTFRNADALLLSTTEQVRSAREAELTHARYQPMPIDTEYFSPSSRGANPRLRIFGAARLDWTYSGPERRGSSLKGNDVLIRGFAKLVGAGVDAELVLRDWGIDVAPTKDLVRELGVEDRITFIGVVHRDALREEYRRADVVVDQFVGGCLGLASLEAMACGTPVVLRFDTELHRGVLEEFPPIWNAATPEEVCAHLRALRDPAVRASSAERSRDWVVRYHGTAAVAERVGRLYERLMS